MSVTSIKSRLIDMCRKKGKLTAKIAEKCSDIADTVRQLPRQDFS